MRPALPRTAGARSSVARDKETSLSSLDRLLSERGETSSYDAVSQCSRCGYCEQSCPTYAATGEEGLSPRGRNQTVRLLLEGTLGPGSGAERLLSTCLLCGACSTACYAHVRVPDLVLEGRRRLRGPGGSRLARAVAWLLERPRLLEVLLGLAYAAKRLGLSRLARAAGVFRLLGLGGLAAADEHLREIPDRLLGPALRRRAAAPPPGARWVYFAPCGPRYVLPRVGEATMEVLDSAGPAACLDAGCCGLVAYNYGELEQARRSARALIEAAERAFAAAAPEAALVADCSSCAAHLKSFPQLFLGDAAWKPRAEAFSARVRDAIEVIGGLDLPAAPAPEGAAACHDSCRARHGQNLSEPPRRALRALADGAYRELPEADVCCGGAGAFAFAQPELSDAVLRRKIGAIAAARISVVATSSTSCLLQLAHGLTKYYPEGRVAHLSELAAEALRRAGR